MSATGPEAVSGSVAPRAVLPGRSGRAGVGRGAIGAILPLVVLVLWAVLSATEVLRPILFPSPLRVAGAFGDFFTGERRTSLPGVIAFTGAGWGHLGASLSRCLSNGSAAIAVGVVGGIGLGRSRTARQLLEPMLNGLRAVPLYAWLPLLIVWLGIGEPSARGLIFLGALWPTLVATADAVGRVPRSYVETARMLGTSRRDLWRRVHLPAALPEIVTGIRLSVTLAWACVVVGELTGAQRGIGAMMNAARETARTEQIVVGVIIFAVVGSALDLLVRLASRRATAWAVQS